MNPIVVNIFKQDCHGIDHWRVMREDGRKIFGRIATDFPSKETAVNSVLSEFRRNGFEQPEIRIK
jgi:hypothetical protein